MDIARPLRPSTNLKRGIFHCVPKTYFLSACKALKTHTGKTCSWCSVKRCFWNEAPRSVQVVHSRMVQDERWQPLTIRISAARNEDRRSGADFGRGLCLKFETETSPSVDGKESVHGRLPVDRWDGTSQLPAWGLLLLSAVFASGRLLACSDKPGSVLSHARPDHHSAMSPLFSPSCPSCPSPTLFRAAVHSWFRAHVAYRLEALILPN